MYRLFMEDPISIRAAQEIYQVDLIHLVILVEDPILVRAARDLMKKQNLAEMHSATSNSVRKCNVCHNPKCQFPES